jgi:SNF2 family DNA or RNA helicase
VCTGGFENSTKTRKIVEKILSVPNSEKVLVFSSFERMLRVLAFALAEERISFEIYSGKQTHKLRRKIVSNFRSKNGPQVLLLTLNAGAEGLNLQVARHVIFADPWWNPTIEDQAIGRAHRYGQQHTVQVSHFVTRGTVEEDILEIQASKRKLDILASGSAAYANFNLTEQDIVRILRLDSFAIAKRKIR